MYTAVSIIPVRLPVAPLPAIRHTSHASDCLHTPALALHLSVFVKAPNINASAKKNHFPFKRGGPLSLKRNHTSRNEVEITMVCSYLLQRRPDEEKTHCLHSSPASLSEAKSFHCVTEAREVVERRRGKTGRLSQALTGVLKVY